MQRASLAATETRLPEILQENLEEWKQDCRSGEKSVVYLLEGNVIQPIDGEICHYDKFLLRYRYWRGKLICQKVVLVILTDEGLVLMPSEESNEECFHLPAVRVSEHMSKAKLLTRALDVHALNIQIIDSESGIKKRILPEDEIFVDYRLNGHMTYPVGKYVQLPFFFEESRVYSIFVWDLRQIQEQIKAIPVELGKLFMGLPDENELLSVIDPNKLDERMPIRGYFDGQFRLVEGKEKKAMISLIDRKIIRKVLFHLKNQ